MTTLKIKRVYLPAATRDGCRVLVDRIWPRGLTKQKAAVDHWLKDVAPSTALRQWFGHDPERWLEFKRRYAAELRANKPVLKSLREILKTHASVTLLFAAHDEAHNNAVALAAYLKRSIRT
ncbi:MAG TPA: DUF488 domain-containing protein [Gammaproteobacteria bacterium]|nr:DUF488 domain-containing protein [Gammaproteobacteria bacterium]